MVLAQNCAKFTTIKAGLVMDGSNDPRIAVFRERTRLILRRRGLKQSDLAAGIGVSRATLVRWLQYGSAALPSAMEGIAIGDYLGVSTRWLWGMVDTEVMPEYLTLDEQAVLRGFRLMTPEQQRIMLVSMTEGFAAVDRAKKKASA